MIPGNTKQDKEWDELFAWLTQLDIEAAEVRTAVDIYIEIIASPMVRKRLIAEWTEQQKEGKE